MICGIDPSYNDNNGVAYWDGEKLISLNSGSFDKMAADVLFHKPTAIVLEDSRLDKHIHAAMGAYAIAVKKSGRSAGIAAAAMTGRNVGKLDGACTRWEDFAKRNNIKIYYVRPSSRRKGTDLKLSAPVFKKITGYEGRTNEHNRDAAMLVFKRKL
mgnify:CR=1 FL=1